MIFKYEFHLSYGVIFYGVVLPERPPLQKSLQNNCKTEMMRVVQNDIEKFKQLTTTLPLSLEEKSLFIKLNASKPHQGSHS